MEKYIDYIIKKITELTNIPSPSGYADKAIDFVKTELNSLGVESKITNKGGLIACISGEDNTRERTISCHVDTLGAMVKKVKDNGRLAFDKIGGYMLNSVEGENCTIHTMEGKTYSGTILTVKPSVHIHGSNAGKIERTLENMEIVIDERVESSSDVRKLGIEVGDFISFDPRTVVTESGFIKSRHLDDKASAGIILGVIKYMKENNITPKYKTNFFFTNYEEVGHGASASVPENTFEFLAVDMGAPGEGQNSSEYAVCICAKDSAGPHDYTLRKKLVNLCREKSIDYRVDIYPSYSSDSTAALKSGLDFRGGIIGTGVFASHSYERTHTDGILNTAKLLLEYIIS